MGQAAASVRQLHAVLHRALRQAFRWGTAGRNVAERKVRRNSFWPVLERAGLPRIRFHDLRHTAATLLLQQGVHPKIVSERQGHSTVGITLDTYSHATPTMQRQATEALDAILMA